MSYRLVYRHGGHEDSIGSLATLDEVNARISHLYDNDVLGTSILRIEEVQDGPRTWQIEYPPAPPAGTRVRIEDGGLAGTVLEVGEGGRIQLPSGANYSWHGLVEDYGPLTEVVETEVEAAARRLRERGYDRPDSTVPASTAKDIRTVLDHVLNGGQL